MLREEEEEGEEEQKPIHYLFGQFHVMMMMTLTFIFIS